MYIQHFSLISSVPLGRREAKGYEKSRCPSICFFVPGAGVEPARLAALVFETSASTDSAIRANVLRGFGDLLPREAYAPIDTFFSKGLQR